jgi:ketosteroid isomerase-like protein
VSDEFAVVATAVLGGRKAGDFFENDAECLGIGIADLVHGLVDAQAGSFEALLDDFHFYPLDIFHDGVAGGLLKAALEVPAAEGKSVSELEAGAGTAENALAAEKEVNQALLTNDADALGRLLADDWIVISAYGGIGERDPFIAAIKSGQFTRKTMDLSDPRVKIYGNTAVVTTQLKTSGTIGGRDFDVAERQTDVLIWKDGAWKSVLLHETLVHK